LPAIIENAEPTDTSGKFVAQQHLIGQEKWQTLELNPRVKPEDDKVGEPTPAPLRATNRPNFLHA
jgi:hypothetical protein